jgi:hypothetical protein
MNNTWTGTPCRAAKHTPLSSGRAVFLCFYVFLCFVLARRLRDAITFYSLTLKVFVDAREWQTSVSKFEDDVCGFQQVGKDASKLRHVSRIP